MEELGEWIRPYDMVGSQTILLELSVFPPVRIKLLQGRVRSVVC